VNTKICQRSNIVITTASSLFASPVPTAGTHHWKKAPRWKNIVRKAGKGTKKKVSLAVNEKKDLSSV
jgi:hypothetical protein